MRAMSYLKDHGVPIINFSGGGSSYSQSYYELISELEVAGVLLTLSAGNEAQDNDAEPHYPSNYDNPNIIACGGHDYDGTIRQNYGQTSVDLFAPARYIKTTKLGGGYTWGNGSSLAAPMVATTAAAIKRIKPDWTAADIKQAILGSVVKDDIYEGLCVSGGRLNAHNALLVANAIDDGRNDVQSEPSSYSLHTADEITAARTIGLEDVTSDPNTFDLYTLPQVSAVATIYRGYGQDDVTSDPSSYSLYTATDLSAAEAASRTLGQQDVTASPETYELATMAQMSNAAEAARTIVNVSARVDLGEGEIVTPGFTVLGEQKKLLIRAVGPKLMDLGVPSPMQNPTMSIYKSRWDGNPPDLVGTIDDWKADNGNVAEIVAAMSSAGAFPLEPTETFQGLPFMTDDTSSAAALLTLDEGVYTVQVRSADEGVGEVLVEVYEITD